MLNCKNTEIYKKIVINMGTTEYNNLPKFLKEIDDYKALKKELKLFLLLQFFTQWKNLYFLKDLPVICV
jgi:hypothetical protein